MRAVFRTILVLQVYSALRVRRALRVRPPLYEFFALVAVRWLFSDFNVISWCHDHRDFSPQDQVRSSVFLLINLPRVARGCARFRKSRFSVLEFSRVFRALEPW